MPRYRATLAYDGSNYAGFQRQVAGTATIQGSVEAALSRVFKQPMTVWAAGRTDAGVHARAQVIAFDANWRHNTATLMRAVNARLPESIAIQDICEHSGFHPRFDALSRVYHYEVLMTAQRQPLLAKRMWQQKPGLDETLMQAAATLLVGKHDFATFGKPPQGNNTVREIFVSAWQAQTLESKRYLTYIIEGTAFLQHMVRRIVSMLVAVGRHLQSLTDFEAAFRRADLAAGGQLAPPHGLYLQAVRYPPHEQTTQEADNPAGG